MCIIGTTLRWASKKEIMELLTKKLQVSFEEGNSKEHGWISETLIQVLSLESIIGLKNSRIEFLAG